MTDNVGLSEKRIAIIINGKTKAFAKVISRFKSILQETYTVNFFITEGQYHACDLAVDSVKCGFNVVLAVGGDGTINEVLNGIMSLPEEMRKKVKLGVVPIGTGNDFARTVNLRYSATHLRRAIDEDRFFDIDIANTLFVKGNGEKLNRYFVNVADFGIGGKVVELTSKSWKIFGNSFAFMFSVLRVFTSFRKRKIHIKGDDFEYMGDCLALWVGNAKYIGGGLAACPTAEVDDGKLNVTIVGNVNVWVYIMNLPKLRKCQIIDHPEIKYLETTTLEFVDYPDKFPIDLDGEFINAIPKKIIIEPKKVSMLKG